MLAIERKNEILAILQKEQKILVAEMAQRFEVTDETIRRDLEKLESEGYVRRTYGGAVLNQKSNMDMPLRIREQTNRLEKQAIARLVAARVEEGDSIMLDSSSTSLMIARELKEKKKLTVVTSSVEVLIELSGHSGIQVISTGGNLRDSSLSLVGTAAQRVLQGYYVDKAIISCKAIDMERGVTDSSDEEADMKNMMRSCAKETILALDSSKFDQVSFVHFMDLSAGDIIATDHIKDDNWKNYLEERGVIVLSED